MGVEEWVWGGGLWCFGGDSGWSVVAGVIGIGVLIWSVEKNIYKK